MAPARRSAPPKQAPGSAPAQPVDGTAPGNPVPGGTDASQASTSRLPDPVVSEVVVRLRRAEGQLRAVQRLLTEGADCRTVLTQLAAANRAVEQAGFRLVAAGLAWCTEHPEDAAAAGYSVEDLERLFTRIA
jgi:DNA-binding FrmR family transcriptional regulator